MKWSSVALIHQFWVINYIGDDDDYKVLKGEITENKECQRNKSFISVNPTIA